MAEHSALPFWPEHGCDEQDAVLRVLRSGRVNYWTGEEGRCFEREFAAFHGAPNAVAVANGTVALELGLRALGVGPGDEVVVTPRTFLAFWWMAHWTAMTTRVSVVAGASN